MKTGMIIVHYNDYESVKQLIDNIKNYKCIDKVVIVDNNSDLRNKAGIRNLISEKVEVIENSLNKGFSYAINIGAKKLINDLGECKLIISNADIIIEKEIDLVGLLNCLNQEDIGVVAPTVVEGNNLNRGWKNPTPKIDALMNLVYVHRKIRKKYVMYNEEHYNDRISYVDVVSGCFFLMRSNVLESINYLDENVFLYYEENILAKKIKNINKKIMVVNDIRIIHNHSVSIDKNIKKIKKLKLQKQSQVYFQKNYNNANSFQVFMLKLTACLSRFVLSIVYFFKDLIKK